MIIFFIVGCIAAVPLAIYLFARTARKNEKRLARMKQIRKLLAGSSVRTGRATLVREATDLYMEIVKTNHQVYIKQAQALLDSIR